MRQHNVWCVCVRSVWRGMQSSIPLPTERKHTHTKCYAAATTH